MQKAKFEVEFLEDAAKFLETLDEKVRDKIIYNINKSRFSSDKELFKKLTDEIWEFRTLYNKTHYRLFAFWDKSEKNNTIIISTHGLIKKTGKTPKADLDKAEKLKAAYFELKSPKMTKK
ncbi:type II toxin-antitoxin system RelE/ParE family toxin [Aquirufa rosea]|uniref:Type II toxin-antitoxin system RelE/ParE family toxin n=1 Tax=Aquirufa rosea TaxID=2509241 RepID=A0A4Q1BXE0_9BACT|nr:type II toxin-antitoxin system RelE/ParE family toxin [Aquirufa rosea]RXK47066.1 type II toxin-antitoxin system RelE/ParE family toxin [Aquirufa rosea]